MQFNPENWTYEFQQRGAHPLLMADMWCRALYYHLPQEIELPVRGFDYLLTSENKGYYSKGQREELLRQFEEKLRDPAYVKGIFDKTIRVTNQFLDFMKETVDDRSWDNFVDHVLTIVPWFYIPWYITEFNLFADKVTKGLEKHRGSVESITDMNNSAMLLMFPDREMELQREQRVFHELVNLAVSGTDVFKDAPEKVKTYLDDFGWMKTFIVVPLEPMTEIELKAKINSAIQDKSYITYAQQETRKKMNDELTAALKNVIKDDQELVYYVDSARYLSWLLTYAVEIALHAFAIGIPWYKRIAQDIGLRYEEWVLLTIDEVGRSLKEKRCVVSKSELEKRKKAHAVQIIDGKVSVLSGDETVVVISSLKQKAQNELQKDQIKEIRGKPACPGKATGKAKVSLKAADAHTIEVGDILVCAMTTPDYVPAMKKAGAIVTDEGGMLCHAAIISRELNKPCVIATKVATTVIKNGDMVEVDADKGIVRILTA